MTCAHVSDYRIPCTSCCFGVHLTGSILCVDIHDKKNYSLIIFLQWVDESMTINRVGCQEI